MKFSAWFFILLILMGCTGAPIAPLSSEQKERIYQADFEKTWRAVLDVLNERSEPIGTIEKDSGIIVTDFVLMSGLETAFFPIQPMQAIRQGRYKLNISVKSASDKTWVRINAHFERFSSIIMVETFPSWKSQNSTGALERQLFDAIEKQLAIEKPNQ